MKTDYHMKKILIIGASGLTGYQLATLAKKDFQVYGTYNEREISIDGCKMSKLDITNQAKTRKLLKDIAPDIIVNCSALHDVDYCETHKDESFEVNVESPKYIAKVSKELEARFVYISTDYVFDGTSEEPYTEQSEPNPLNYYGKSKLQAEKEIASVVGDYAIARTSLIFGWNPHELSGMKSSSGKSQNYVIWALKKLRNNESLRIVTDQYSTPTFANNLAEMLLTLAQKQENGIFHTAGKTCLNRYDFTLQIADVFGLSKDLISPVLSEEFEQVAERPMKPCLDVSKMEGIAERDILTSLEALKEMKKLEKEY